MRYYVVKFAGVFGFIKPWTAVRDGETFSQQFLTPSIIEGIEKKLFPELMNDAYWGKIVKIKRYRLNYQGIDIQQERTWSKGGINIYKESVSSKGETDIDKKVWQYKTNMGILSRGVMLNPVLYLAFDNADDAITAFAQTVCLCRNEDLMHPVELHEDMDENDFDAIDGFELIFTDASQGFKVGHNRFADAGEMFGELKIYGNPVRINS
jgi:hypothetical protein